eukprot:jgi/Botrbrau1/12532/Bobra.0169s0074.1
MFEFSAVGRSRRCAPVPLLHKELATACVNAVRSPWTSASLYMTFRIAKWNGSAQGRNKKRQPCHTYDQRYVGVLSRRQPRPRRTSPMSASFHEADIFNWGGKGTGAYSTSPLVVGQTPSSDGQAELLRGQAEPPSGASRTLRWPGRIPQWRAEFLGRPAESPDGLAESPRGLGEAAGGKAAFSERETPWEPSGGRFGEDGSLGKRSRRKPRAVRPSGAGADAAVQRIDPEGGPSPAGESAVRTKSPGEPRGRDASQRAGKPEMPWPAPTSGLTLRRDAFESGTMVVQVRKSCRNMEAVRIQELHSRTMATGLMCVRTFLEGGGKGLVGAEVGERNNGGTGGAAQVGSGEWPEEGEGVA